MALSLLLIMALLAGMFEAAGSLLSRAHVRLYLDAASMSAMGEYYGPLFERYGIFAIDTGFGGPVSDREALSDLVAGYLPEQTGKRSLEELRILSVESIVEGSSQGHSGYAAGVSELTAQMLEAGKTDAARDAAELLLEKLGVLARGSAGAAVLAGKLETEEALSALDSARLELMCIIDGVDISLFDGVSVSSSFVKKLQPSDATMISVGINNREVYSLLAPHYVNGVTLAQELLAAAELYADKLEKRDRAEQATLEGERRLKEAEDRRDAALLRKSELEQKVAELDESEPEDVEPKDVEPKTAQQKAAEQEATEQKAAEREAAKREVAELENELVGINADVIARGKTLITLRSRQREARVECASRRSEAEGLFNEMCVLAEETRDRASEARDKAEQTASLQKTLQTAVLAYQQLAGKTDSADIGRMRSFVGLDGQASFDPGRIKRLLDDEIRLLEDVCTLGRKGFTSDNSSAARSWCDSLSALPDILSGCGACGINFDYSGVRTGTIFQNIADEAQLELRDRLSRGLLSLLITGREISDRQLKSDYRLGDGQEKAGAGFSVSDIVSMLDQPDIGGLAELLRDAGELLEQKLLLMEYAGERFGNYVKPDAKGITALKYEQEYLIAGYGSDEADLAGVAARIFAIRLVPALLFALSDSETAAAAEALALASMSFTGLPFLIKAVKYIIIGVMAAEQALVETSALLRGKSVPVLTGRETFCISTADIFALSPELIGRKAELIGAGKPGLTYSDYLCLLLLLESRGELEGHVTCLIEANLRNAYDDDFRLCNCITGFTAEAVYRCPVLLVPRFLTPNGWISGYTIREEAHYHY